LLPDKRGGPGEGGRERQKNPNLREEKSQTIREKVREAVNIGSLLSTLSEEGRTVKRRREKTAPQFCETVKR